MLIYKICLFTHWLSAKDSKEVPLAKEDTDFIHFSTLEQVDKVLHKFFCNEKVAILTIDSTLLVGDLRYEANAANTHKKPTKYYHLYNGSIPFKAIVDVEIRNTQEVESHSHSEVHQNDF